MPAIHLSAIFGIFLFYICKKLFPVTQEKKQDLHRLIPITFFLLAILVRILAAAFSKGFDSDTACFAAWADRVFDVGLSGFYSADVFTDYPPGYIYLLYPIGALRKLLNITYYSATHLLMLRVPAIVCDMLTGWLLYHEAEKRFHSSLRSLLFAALYLFNPVVILNTSVWGQVDSVYTLFLVLICLCLCSKKTIPTYFLFALGVLIKPQMLIFAPVLAVGILQHVILTDFKWVKFLNNLFAGLTAILLDLLLILPFGLSTVIDQYLSTVTSYPYAAVNAFNFWGLLGLNWIPQDTTFLGIAYSTYGYLGIIASVVLIFVYAFRHKKDTSMYPLLSALLMAGVFCFSVRMHERYLYPAVILLLFAVVVKPSVKLFLAYCGFSIFHFYNTAFVLFFYDPYNYNRTDSLIILVSAGTLIALGFLIYAAFSKKEKADLFARTEVSKTAKEKKTNHLPSFTPSAQLAKFTLLDFILILALTGFYSYFAFRDLGDRVAPETTLTLHTGESMEFVFTAVDDMLPTKLAYYTALPNDIELSLEAKANDDTSDWQAIATVTLDNIFTWKTVDLPIDSMSLLYTQDVHTQAVYRFVLNSTDASLLELVFLDENDRMILPDNASSYAALFDEQDLYPQRSSFRNGMYFDEIYHARTAYEFLNGEVTYENTHPPLGKILIALGVKFFGMNPFGWRFMGTLFGVLMVPLVYLFAKELFGLTSLSFLAAFLYAFDFMHFTQTRIATIDVYITFFVILMYYFMYRYTKLSFYDRPLYKTFLPLGACGIAMGLGVASKWTGVYAGMGLAIIFFLHLFRLYKESSNRLQAQSIKSSPKKAESWALTFAPKCLKTIAFCLVFFVVIPFTIYVLSYLPFRDYSSDGLFTRMLNNQQAMLSYHSNLEATHPYSSSWYEWPTMIKPVWYYSSIVTGSAGNGGLREGISAFGNPLVWWVGIPICFYMLYLAFKKKDKTATFLLIGYFAQYLPWFLVSRVTFMYHYFPSVVFVVLMIAYSLKTIKTKINRKIFLAIVLLYCIAAFVLFLLFYPVLAGQAVDADYVINTLRWLKGWVLVAS